jgi:hypothetical protein
MQAMVNDAGRTQLSRRISRTVESWLPQGDAEQGSSTDEASGNLV